ncbi:hypothetical protein [Nocardia sp. NPDC051570]|uniref:hypothetical protein n=1 Tax=Nocardia sp. NPDC051570 TaxID=3364324 RepID=UPI0037B29157
MGKHSAKRNSVGSVRLAMLSMTALVTTAGIAELHAPSQDSQAAHATTGTADAATSVRLASNVESLPVTRPMTVADKTEAPVSAAKHVTRVAAAKKAPVKKVAAAKKAKKKKSEPAAPDLGKVLSGLAKTLSTGSSAAGGLAKVLGTGSAGMGSSEGALGSAGTGSSALMPLLALGSA